MKSVWELENAKNIVENAPEGVEYYDNKMGFYYKVVGDKVYYWDIDYNKFDKSGWCAFGVSSFLDGPSIYSLSPKEEVVKVREGRYS